MESYINDLKVKKAETIFSISRVLFGIMTAILAITGLILVIVPVAASNNGDFNWRLLVGGFSCWFGILFVWIFKQILDGFAIIVYNSAVNLYDRGVVTSIDEVYNKDTK